MTDVPNRFYHRFGRVLLALLSLDIGEQVFAGLLDALDLILDEVGEVHLVVFAVEVGEGIVFLGPQDDPGDGHVLEEPVALREDVPVEDAACGPAIAVLEGVDVADEEVEDDAPPDDG